MSRGISPETSSGGVPQSVIETEAKQRAALVTVQRLSRMAGRELPIIPVEYGDFADEPGVYLFDQEAIGSGDIQDVNFVMDRRKSSGAADSAHAVISGALAVELRDGTSREVEIGAKCYQKRTVEDRLARAHKEVNFMRYMARTGQLAMEPVGVAIAPPEVGTEVVLLTRWNDDLLTFDNNPWGRGPSRGTLEDAVKGAAAIARVNIAGVEHNDAKVKNVATDNRTGKVGMIDFETATFFDLENPIEAAAATHNDFEKYMESLAAKGFFNVRMSCFTPNTEQIVRAVQEICEQGYLPLWQDAPEPVQNAVYDEIVHIAERITQSKLGHYAAAAAV